MRTKADVRQRLRFHWFTAYRRRVTVDAGSTPGSSRSADGFGIASITSMPRGWQIFSSPAGSAAAGTKGWVWLIWGVGTRALRPRFVEAATSIPLRALAMMGL